MIVLHKFKDDTPKAPLTKPMFAKEVPQGKKDTKRQTSSRFNVSKNRELTRLPPLKDASVSFHSYFNPHAPVAQKIADKR